jgi:hypothetical protein
MANIKVNDLQPLEVESMYLTQFEVEQIGGGFLRKFLRRVDQTVRRVVPGGWVTVGRAVLGF